MYKYCYQFSKKRDLSKMKDELVKLEKSRFEIAKLEYQKSRLPKYYIEEENGYVKIIAEKGLLVNELLAIKELYPNRKNLVVEVDNARKRTI